MIRLLMIIIIFMITACGEHSQEEIFESGWMAAKEPWVLQKQENIDGIIYAKYIIKEKDFIKVRYFKIISQQTYPIRNLEDVPQQIK